MKRSVHRVSVAPKLEKRAEGEGECIVGFIPYYDAWDPGTEYELWEGMVERLMPGCFNNAVAEGDDARGLFNHSASLLLGRVSTETVRLSAEPKGLRYEIDAPDTSAGRDVVELIRRGDLDGSSFAFSTWGKRGKIVWVEEPERTIREIHDLELFDVSPVTYPAYESATSALRSVAMEKIRGEFDAWQQERNAGAVKVDRRRLEMRLRMLEIDEGARTT